MNGRNDQDLVLLRDTLNKLDDFVASRRVKSTCRFVEKEYLWGRDQLTGDADTSLLTARHTLADRRPDQSIGLRSEAEGGQERSYKSLAGSCWYGTWECELSGEVECFADGEGADQSVFLLDVRTHFTK